jgi:mutator protein MutT
MVCTLVFLLRKGEILLAMKKRGFGSDRWNGIGGKVEAGETITEAMVRECIEEIGVTPIGFTKVALHEFVFPDGKPQMTVHTFICDAWDNEPIETDEMAPEWFKLSDIPYDDMWQDDRYWLPQVLEGQKLHTRFTFDDNEQLTDQHIHQMGTA